MQFRRGALTICLLFATGCGSLRPDPVAIRERTVTVSGDDPFIEMEEGTRLGVDGIPSGQTMPLTLSEYRDGHGRIVVDVE
jgi:hypothetical protein